MTMRFICGLELRLPRAFPNATTRSQCFPRVILSTELAATGYPSNDEPGPASVIKADRGIDHVL